MLGGGVELDAPPRAKAGEVPAFPIPAAAVIDREPESTEQVLFVGDSPRSHDDSRDRVVDDLLLGASGTPRASLRRRNCPIRSARRLWSSAAASSGDQRPFRCHGGSCASCPGLKRRAGIRHTVVVESSSSMSKPS